ncbi:MAG: GAF domain-containing protein [Thermoanaerobaculales bacterium]|jgi:HD-GYP domain-containing protein (c-di-GMP phosphodiesterase class II)|nr:GAF domain-containing protein [Thermoanaerobaculales bacterium]
MNRATTGFRSRAEDGVVRYPLHVTLAAVFITAIVLFGVVIITYTYLEGRRTELLGAQDQMKRIGRQLRSDIAGLYQPAQSLVDIASRSEIWAGESLDDRLAALPAIAEALRLNPSISALYLGTADGEFFLIRSLEPHRAGGEVLEAPAGSEIAIQSVERDRGSTIETLLFFDAGLGLLERRPIGDTGFDPRRRDWYRQAMLTDGLVSTGFYIFYTTGEVGLTFARRHVGGGGVIGADITLEDLEIGLERERITPATRLAATDRAGRVIALSEPGLTTHLTSDAARGTITMPSLADLDDPAFRALAGRLPETVDAGPFELEAGGERWLASVIELPGRSAEPALLSILIPRRELLADVDRIRNRSLAISAVLLGLAIGLVLWISRNVSSSLRALAIEAADIRRFKLGREFRATSRISEVAELGETMAVMKGSLQQFFEISRALSAEKDQQRLLEMILREACKVAHADGGAILLASDDRRNLEMAILEIARAGIHVGGTSGVEPSFAPVPVESATDVAGRSSLDSTTAARLETVTIADAASDLRFDLRRIHERFDSDGYECRSVLSVPLADQKGELVGLMQLVNARDAGGGIDVFDPEVVPFVEALSSDAAVALDLRRLIKAQKDLLEAFIHVVADAIDAKSPYTHGHCQRVPVIARLLAERADRSSRPPFDGFSLSEDEWYELHIASWLHDCGKMTTPEYVVDKSTKLETLADRIHEIRTRFELLWRDAEIDYWRARAMSSPEDPEARRRLADRLERIRADWAFIAECNTGEVPMDDGRLARLREIAGQTWRRHLDDRLGLSHEELERKSRTPAAELPATEALLADKPEHVIERHAPAFGSNPHGFKMEVPEHHYNRGELYNLSVRRGTLTAEERFRINDHIIQTINMLGRLPFPRELARVPDWAGNHHERLDGTGYPRRLTGDELSIPERIMAIADVFEALTAADRPYMRPKSMSTALGIMAKMRDDGHLCPDLFELFLDSGVWREYGDEYLQPEQMDEVDITSLRRRVD